MRLISKLFFGVMTTIAILGCERANLAQQETLHSVEVENPRFATSKTTLVAMTGVIEAASVEVAGARDFKISISLPLALKPQASLGSTFDVELPLLAGSIRRASVAKKNSQTLELSLKNEIHDLAGQVARVRLPVETKTVFEVPVAALFSPMGNQSFVFLVAGNRVEKVQVEILNSTKNGMVLLASEQIQEESQIVIRGLDNLVDGDSVQIGEEHARTK